MPFTLTDVRRALTGKLGLELDESKRHPTFTFWHDGRVLARTHISHGSGRQVSDGIVSAMARQLGITGPQLREAISCRIDGDTFAALVVRAAAGE